MEFDSGQPIYLQIADLVCDSILRGVWKPGERIPSIRDMASQISVNPNTVVKAYNYLESQKIILNQRGIGFFVSDQGYAHVLRLKQELFISKECPRFFRQMNLVGISWENLQKLYEEFQQNEKETERKSIS
ncbi:GntR family transcriptional regulator [Thermospira aquatica]|uniref:GntR family transcriptional regulator n=1 Tax=Thermospira aquatica TaxID=2828656 RepID=A0AAX3BDQ5_9SPIR|nr:GntR family transcriptional regulator [Thermospira aquatica]URA10468.1 GntR family transcriptional regulator [Thermospira aquatica]